MASTKDLLQMDLYGLLGVERSSTEKQIKKAYRQKALSCHPDKNPDNPKAAELFHKLSQALEVLTDAAARAAYDKLHAAKKQAEERNNRLDDQRKKLKLDLEARERQAESQTREEFQVTRTLEEEIARLREEGSRQLEEEQRRIQKQIQKEREWRLTDADLSSAQQDISKVTPKLKLKWKCKKEDDTNSGYSNEVLQGLLQKYGDVLNLIISSKKKGSAVVEFATTKAAERAFKYESGLPGNPIKITWLEGQPESTAPTTFENSAGTFTSSQGDSRLEFGKENGTRCCPGIKQTSGLLCSPKDVSAQRKGLREPRVDAHEASGGKTKTYSANAAGG